jgi:hypothetical protein
MDKLTRYRSLIKEILRKYAELINTNPQPGRETELIFDEKRDHYMLVHNGWSGTKRFRGTTVYVRIRNEKFWIEEDWLEYGITPDLLEAGVPKEDIILAFQSPKMRQYTEFATA